MSLILVEDDQFKLNKIKKFLENYFPADEIDVVSSVTSAKKKFSENSYSLAIIDMSLPTFTVGVAEPGGRPQAFGGKEIFRFMNRKGIVVPTIVVTQFERFGKKDEEKDISTLTQEIKRDYSINFVGLVYYDSNEKWINDFKLILEELLENRQ